MFKMGFWNKEISPVTLDEFNTWVDDVIAHTRLPNNDSIKFAVASIVLEAKDLLTHKQAARKLEKGAQNQFAAFVFQDIKARRIAEDQAKAAAEQAEATERNAQSDTVDKAAIASDAATEVKSEAPEVNPTQVPDNGSEKPAI
jgi:hypothetical protein